MVPLPIPESELESGGAEGVVLDAVGAETVTKLVIICPSELVAVVPTRVFEAELVVAGALVVGAAELVVEEVVGVVWAEVDCWVGD